MTYRTIASRLAVAVLIAGMPFVAHASDKDRARAAIAEADAEIQAAWRAGAADHAADTQARAVATLDRARHQFARSHEHHAYYAAREADAYARLALAASQTAGTR